jgi:hypothetical protein
MLSQYDLLYHPNEVQPIGSRKGVLNKPTHIVIDLEELFLSSANTNNLHASLHAIYKQNGGKGTFAKFGQLIKLLQKKFVKENRLQDYNTAESQATGINNYVDALRAINNDFHKLVYRYFKWNMYNPYKDDIEVGPNDNRILKKSSEIMPEDFNTLDVWREQFTLVLNRQFRDCNRIPVHRVGLHSRHIDRGNEGLRENDAERSSLETPIYGYDMTNINDTLCNYKQEEWYGN